MATLLSKEDVLYLPKPSGSLSYGDRVVRAGDFFHGVEGERMLVLTSGLDVYYQITKPFPMHQGKVGQVYRARAEEVRNDMQFSGAGTISNNLKATQSVIHMWLDGCLAAAAFAGGPVGWAASAVPVMDFVSKNVHKVPAYQRLVEALMDVRAVLEPNTKVLWAKVLGGLLIEFGKSVPGMGLDMMVSFVKGKVISKTVIGRVINHGITVKDCGWHWRKKTMLVREMLNGVVRKVIVHVKTELKNDLKKELKEEQVKALAVWVLKYLGKESVTLSETEAQQIVREVAVNAEKIQPAIDKLIDAMAEVEMLNA